MRSGHQRFCRHRACDRERHFGRVNVVERPVGQRKFHIHYWESRERACLERFSRALFDRRYELLGYRAASNLALKLNA